MSGSFLTLLREMGPGRIVKAFGYSCKGFVSCWRNEAAFRQEVVLAVVLVPVALFVDVTRLDRVLMICSLLLIILVELVNSAVENAIDRIGNEHDELSGNAKDQGSAAVLVAFCIAFVIWVSALTSELPVS